MPPYSSTESLQALAKKWKTAAQEAAQELWSLAQSGITAGAEPSPSASSSNKTTNDGGFASWGYKEDDDVLEFLKGGASRKPNKTPQSDWGWDEVPSKDGETMDVDEGIDDLDDPVSPDTLAAQIGIGRPAGKRSDADDDAYYDTYSRSSSSRSGGWGSYGAPPSGRSNETDDGGGGLRSDDAGDDSETVQNNIGTMLLQLGIPKEILGWNDEDEDFY